MSNDQCPNCHEAVSPRSVHCDACGLPIRAPRTVSAHAHGGIHAAAPFVFVVAGLAIGAAAALAVSLAVGVPLGLLGGGIGVWMLERGRRII